MAKVKLLTTDEYAAIYQLSKSRVIYMCNAGKIPAQKVGSRWRIAVPAELVDDPEGETREQTQRRALIEMLDGIQELVGQTKQKILTTL